MKRNKHARAVINMKREEFRILHLMSCRGWSSDAYWTGSAVRELREIGHHVTLVCQEGVEERVGRRLR
ncbi:MAG TPA: hypothetical protein VJO34_06090, partial [Methylomirabilota bacterium]|nr:hypothetical protein [Methylomirabilota bacterium]